MLALVKSTVLPSRSLVGGFGHLLFFGQGGFLDHADTKENLRLFAKEVLPRLRDLNPEAKRAAAE